ncbi:MAG: HAD-IC family P-type ATPase [Acetobacteraceae bacterium]|nr:HAD-IC family P-type ATPase [Acetobacteraceae bacterium]
MVPGATAGGLTSAEAQARLHEVGANEVAEAQEGAARRVLGKLWAPVPWMLEAAMLLELWRGRFLEAGIIAALVLFNAAVALFQEGRAQAALAALKTRLALDASVRRDGAWTTIPARQVVPGDLVKLSLGGVVPADARLVGGDILLDQSMLTGESAPVEAGVGAVAYAGALVRRGEAEAIVTATGARTKSGRTAELVRTAHVVGTQQTAVLGVVRNLAVFNGVVIVALVLYAIHLGSPMATIEPLVLTSALASIPVALPATFTMAAALAAHALARRGVLPTRLSALDEAGTMDVLCSDKTGTLTRNELRVAHARPFPGFDEARLLALAALASSDGGADPVDAAIRAAARPVEGLPERIAFQPFDPHTRRAEAEVRDAKGEHGRVMKGAFAVIADAAGADAAGRREAELLEAEGNRVLAVAVEIQGRQQIAGLIALADPPREDAALLVGRLSEHGVRVLMLTGDAAATAEAVARKVGIEGPVATPGAAKLPPQDCAVFAGVLPEDKFDLVRGLQAAGHTVGMCGDGANDAPALRQAHLGIAVSTAADVAKAAAGLVLTEPGLGGVMAAIEEGRRAFRRVATYALNSITKKIVTLLFIATGFVMTGQAILTPLLMIVLLLVGDFLAMALATDRVTPSRAPNVWRVDALTAAAAALGFAQLLFASAVLAIGTFLLRLAPDAAATLAFLTLVFGGQALIYAIRTGATVWETPPGGWLVAASAFDVAIGIVVATTGWIAAPLPAAVVAVLLAASVAFTFLLNRLRRLVGARMALA